MPLCECYCVAIYCCFCSFRLHFSINCSADAKQLSNNCMNKIIDRFAPWWTRTHLTLQTISFSKQIASLAHSQFFWRKKNNKNTEIEKNLMYFSSLSASSAAVVAAANIGRFRLFGIDLLMLLTFHTLLVIFFLFRSFVPHDNTFSRRRCFHYICVSFLIIIAWRWTGQAAHLTDC